MRKFLALFISLLTVFAVAAALCACSSPASAVTDERAMAQIRQDYRSASLVVRGKCVELHNNADGEVCCDLEITEVVAGDADVGDRVHCTGADMWVDSSYLVYLTSSGDVSYAEDEAAYSIVSALEIVDNAVTVSGVRIDYSVLRTDVRKLNSVIGAPGNFYYYSDVSALCAGADEIFIGRAGKVGELRDTDLRVSENGSTAEYTIPAAVTNVTVYGNIKGQYSYGDTVRLVYSPATSADIVDAVTLTAASYTASDAPKLSEGGLYMFFLIKGTDSKQDYYFCVNPMQGYITIDEDSIHAPYENIALKAYSKLDALVTDIRTVLS